MGELVVTLYTISSTAKFSFAYMGIKLSVHCTFCKRCSFLVLFLFLTVLLIYVKFHNMNPHTTQNFQVQVDAAVFASGSIVGGPFYLAAGISSHLPSSSLPSTVFSLSFL